MPNAVPYSPDEEPESGGRRLKSSAEYATPLISIVTATRNAAAQLPNTIDSLRKQTFHDFEWIVVDGNSNDGTVDLLRANSIFIDVWETAPDDGIYDAWNKACRLIRGRWVLFLGAGDVLAEDTVLERVATILSSTGAESLIVYGQVRLLSAEGRQPLDLLGNPWREIAGRWEIGRPMLPPHGATFHHYSILSVPTPFDTRFRIAADSKLLLATVLRRAPIFVPLTVTCAPIGGLSFRLDSAAQMAGELRTIIREFGLTPPLRHRIGEFARQLIIAMAIRLPAEKAFALADFLRTLVRKPRRWTIR